MSDKDMRDLRRRMIADMTVRSFSDKTQHDYIRHIETLRGFLRLCGAKKAAFRGWVILRQGG